MQPNAATGVSPPRRGASLLAALAAGALLAAPAAGQDAAPRVKPAAELQRLEHALREDESRASELKRAAEALEQEIQALRVESIAAARKAQDLESHLNAIEARLASLEQEEREKVRALRERRRQLGRTLAALQRIAIQPSNAMLLAPGSPIDTVRSGLLLRAAIPAIETRARALRQRLEALAAVREEIGIERAALAGTAEALDEEQERLSTVIERKSALRARTTEQESAATQRAAQLAARAGTLRDLLQRIEEEAAARAAPPPPASKPAPPAMEAPVIIGDSAPASNAPANPPIIIGGTAEPPPAAAAQRQQLALAKPPTIRSFPAAGKALMLPVRGRLTTRFGQPRGGTGASRGIVFQARKGAQVVAPFDGKVIYAGAFRSYGQILIIEHGGRYHTLLAGLDRIDAVVGQWLLAGEPVGVLASRDSDPELYLELRQAGQPVNPLPWLADTGDKVRG